MRFYDGASGEIRNNTFNEFDLFGIYLGFPGPVEMTDNIIESGVGYSGLFVASMGNLTVTRNIFSCSNQTLYFTNAPQDNFNFHTNHILRNSGEFVLTPDLYGWSEHLDLTNNYWGTTDVEEIAAHIIDGNDLPNSNLIVDFEPIADGPVPTAQTTLDGLKAMYR